MKGFPKEILVTWEGFENDDPYMVIHENMQDAAEKGKKIAAGVYDLSKIIEVTCEVKSA